MLAECAAICARETRWLLNQCWVLGAEMDDDVMDQQKYCSAALVLASHLVAIAAPYDPALGHRLPEVPLHVARQIMTRADFIQAYDHINIFTIDSRGMVRADSVPMQSAFREVCTAEGFREHLERTLERIGAIESLGRTREVVAKDLVGGGKYVFEVGKRRGGEGGEVAEVGMRSVEGGE
ncbi:hypothetical protein MMC17_001002 [Xylographa soralifera]|nr:hypothetical protein [Xylographa soralifera]